MWNYFVLESNDCDLFLFYVSTMPHTLKNDYLEYDLGFNKQEVIY